MQISNLMNNKNQEYPNFGYNLAKSDYKVCREKFRVKFTNASIEEYHNIAQKIRDFRDKRFDPTGIEERWKPKFAELGKIALKSLEAYIAPFRNLNVTLRNRLNGDIADCGFDFNPIIPPKDAEKITSYISNGDMDKVGTQIDTAIKRKINNDLEVKYQILKKIS